MDDLSDKFILINMKSQVLLCDPNFKKKEEYTAKCDNDNHKNELYYIMRDIKLNGLELLSSCLQRIFDNTHKFPTLKLVSMVLNDKQTHKLVINLKMPVFTYENI